MAITSARVTVTNTPVALNTASTAMQTLLIKNTSANAADLGPSTVAAGTGEDLAGAATMTVVVKAGEVLYAIRSGGLNATLAVLAT
jgi:hypothetical protein